MTLRWSADQGASRVPDGLLDLGEELVRRRTHPEQGQPQDGEPLRETRRSDAAHHPRRSPPRSAGCRRSPRPAPGRPRTRRGSSAWRRLVAAPACWARGARVGGTPSRSPAHRGSDAPPRRSRMTSCSSRRRRSLRMASAAVGELLRRGEALLDGHRQDQGRLLVRPAHRAPRTAATAGFVLGIPLGHHVSPRPTVGSGGCRSCDVRRTLAPRGTVTRIFGASNRASPGGDQRGGRRRGGHADHPGRPRPTSIRARNGSRVEGDRLVADRLPPAWRARGRAPPSE